ncbi:hypothetical protein Mapa_014060 [Marchantia paleacea]|nr:hypothetical protein Mapa_014060 [Marchantia paleacea]
MNILARRPFPDSLHTVRGFGSCNEHSSWLLWRMLKSMVQNIHLLVPLPLTRCSCFERKLIRVYAGACLAKGSTNT